MSFLGDVAGAIFGGDAKKAVDNTWEDIKGAANDVVEWVDKKIVQPILDDPVRFIVIAAAYTYGIPGLDFAAAGSAAATGIASGAYSLASGKSIQDSLKDGLITAAGTGLANYVKAEYFGSTPTDGITVEGGGGENIAGGAGVDSGVDTGGLGEQTAPPMPHSSGPVATSPLDPTSLDPASFDPTQPSNPFAPKLQPELPSALDLDMGQPAPPEVNIHNLQGNTNAGTPAINAETNPQMNAGQTGNSIYRSSVPDLTGEPPYVPGSASQPATGTPDKWGPHPDYPNNPNMRVKLESGQPGLPEVVDRQTLATPMDGGTPTAGQAWDYTKELGNAAVDFAIDHPYYTAGGLYLASQALGKKDKPKDDGGGGDPNKQIGDPRFYQPMQQLEMIQNYDPYKNDIYTYGQTGGEHQFLTSPVYVPVQYAEGGPVKMAGGGVLGKLSDQLSDQLSDPLESLSRKLRSVVATPTTTPTPVENTGYVLSAPSPTVFQTAPTAYAFDPYTYGQYGGENRFYADGGQVSMPPTDPMQQQYQSPAVGPMMAPPQMPPQQPMGALSQVNSMANQPARMAPGLGQPPVPRQAPRLGAPAQVTPQQQNPAYRYFSYGQIPPTVGAPLQPVQQMPQQKATGGLAMARGGNVADGRTDNIPALLSPGEYVMDAETVALLGNGNNDAGAKRLDYMREAVRKQKGGALAKGKISPDAQSPLAYLSRRMA